MTQNIKKAAIYCLLAYGLSWSLALAAYLTGLRLDDPLAVTLLLVYMFMPMVSALIVQHFISHEPVSEPLGLSFKINRWWFVGWFLPPIIAVLAMAVSIIFANVSYSPGMEGMFESFKETMTSAQIDALKEQMKAIPIHPFWIGAIQGLIAGVTINAIAAFGEELGWRGLLQKELGGFGFWQSSAMIGIIWGLWHAPIIIQGYNYPKHPLIGILMMTIFTMLLAPLLSYVRIRSGSVIAASIMHGTINGTAGLAIMVIKGGSDLTVGITGLAGLIALAGLNLILYLYDRFVSAIPVSVMMSVTGEEEVEPSKP